MLTATPQVLLTKLDQALQDDRKHAAVAAAAMGGGGGSGSGGDGSGGLFNHALV